MSRTVVGAAALALVAVAGGCGSSAAPKAAPGPATTLRPGVARQRARPIRLGERALGQLAAPLQDAAAAAAQGGVVLAGGLTAADTSSSEVTLVRGGSPTALASLPAALHDTAAAALGGKVYIFGGGDGVNQLDAIRSVGAGGAQAGRLPAPSSDQSAAVVGGTAYVVGGYTGTRWLDTIVAWRPGGTARVVAHLPQALRYAAVAAAGGRVVIAGGSTPAGTASQDVLVFDPATHRVRRVGQLPAPTTHAAAAAAGTPAGIVYVVGGRGATVNTPTDRIVAVDPLQGTVRVAGVLAAPRSDLAAVDVGGTIVLAGGRGPAGTVDTISKLVAVAASKSSLRAVPRLLSPVDVYAADRPNQLRGAARLALDRVYVPNSQSGTVDVIDPKQMRVVAHFAVGSLPQHVVPAYDLRSLYVTNDLGNTLTRIDPRTGRPGGTFPVEDPYNMYFTPDGSAAIVVAERLARLDFRDSHTFKLQQSVPVPCRGVDHMDFTADGTKALATCEFSGQLVVVDLTSRTVLETLTVDGGHGMPQDVKLSPDGRVFYVADLAADGTWMIDAHSFRLLGLVHTGSNAHGLYPSRDSRYLYVSNRGAGTVSVISFRTRKVVKTWTIPGGGSPDMGGVSADGKVLWLSGRYNAEVYAISTVTGRLLARIPVGQGPHGLCVWPQPGRYSLGHTGILR